MVYLRYSFFDAFNERSVVIDSSRVHRFPDIAKAAHFVSRKEDGRFPLYKGTLFRREKGREISLIAYSRGEENDLKVTPLV